MSDIKRESFVFYRSFYESLSELTDESVAKAMRAICEYALNGVDPTLSGIEKAVFVLIKPQIDANNKRYLNGKAGGRKQTGTKQEPKHNQEQTESEANANVNVNVNVNANDNANEKCAAASPGSPDFIVSSSGISAPDGSKRIEKARALYNASGIKPEERYTVLQFKPDDLRDCLATIQAFTDEDIADALKNYCAITKSAEHDVAYPYRSFVGFMRAGVAKFVSSADPWTAYRKKLAPTATKPGAVMWPGGGSNANG